MTGWLHRATASIYATDDDKYGDLVVFMNTPSELVIHDLFVHKSMPFAHHPQTLVYSQLPGEGAPVFDHHVHPVEPRMLRLTFTVRW
jgi:hypothetical protein